MYFFSKEWIISALSTLYLNILGIIMARYRQTHNNCRKATTSEIIWEVYIKVTIRNKNFSLSSFT